MEAAICSVCAVISIGLNYWLIPVWGMIGAALAFAVSCTTVVLWEAVQLFFYSGIHALSRSCLGPLILGGALTILATELKIWSLWAALALIVGGYLVAIFLLFLDQEDKQILAVFTGRLKKTVYAHITL
jgi:O-antigen/teichoic acid export membrane protein